MTAPERWSEWITHDGTGNPVPIGWPVIVDMGGRTHFMESNEDGPWWHNGIIRSVAGRPVRGRTVRRYRIRVYAAGRALIAACSDCGARL